MRFFAVLPCDDDWFDGTFRSRCLTVHDAINQALKTKNYDILLVEQ